MAIEHASEAITGISSMATRQMLAELCDVYQGRSGQKVAVISVGGVDALRRVRAGEAFDFVVLAADAIERLGAEGKIDPGSRVDLAGSGVAIAVKAGTRPPDIADENAVCQAVLDARSIGCSTGPSGEHLRRLFERWGIAQKIAPRIVQAPPGIPVATLLTRAEAELGFQQLSELIGVPGVDIVGPLPPKIQAITVFSGAVCTASRRPETASALLAYLGSSEAEAAKRRHGLEPV